VTQFSITKFITGGSNGTNMCTLNHRSYYVYIYIVLNQYPAKSHA